MPALESVVFALTVARQLAGIYMNLDTAARQNDDADGEQEKLKALEVTLEEWIQRARALDPTLPRPLQPDRVQYAFEQYDRLRDKSAVIKNPLSVPLNTQHSAVSVGNDGYSVLLLGQSNVTKSLLGMSAPLDVRFPFAAAPPSLPLPVFNVTMLGKSGSGKTVYMSAMYTRLVDGFENIALRATDPDVDLELRQMVEAFLLDKKWPLGSVGDQKEYNFELLIHGKAVASVNWIDYRGGDISDRDSDAAAAIRERIRQSHAIIWVVDMTSIRARSVTSTAAKLQTGIGRYAALCRETTTEPKSWIFVRSKSDTVRDDAGAPDMVRAAQELKEHLGDTARTVVDMGSYSKGILVPISSTGPVATVGKDQVPEGEDPINVHWPFLLALASLLEGELQRLSETGVALQKSVKTLVPGSFFRRILKLGPTPEEAAWADKCSRIGRELLRVQDVIRTILANVPEDEILFLDRTTARK